jgi:hypothetical protein
MGRIDRSEVAYIATHRFGLWAVDGLTVSRSGPEVRLWEVSPDRY